VKLLCNIKLLKDSSGIEDHLPPGNENRQTTRLLVRKAGDRSRQKATSSPGIPKLKTANCRGGGGT